MSTEYEAKVLDVDLAESRHLILAKGGVCVTDTRLMRRYVYDMQVPDPAKWIRLRDDGERVTVTYKHILHDGIDGTTELETDAKSDFETAAKILRHQGFSAKAYQENRRTSFVLEGCQVELDEWPLIPPYMEIEGPSREEVIRVAGLLGYTESELTGKNTTKVYSLQYGIDITTIRELRFDS